MKSVGLLNGSIQKGVGCERENACLHFPLLIKKLDQVCLA